MKYDRPIIALDFPDKEKTFEFLKKFPEDEKLFVKVGMELFYSEGSDMVKELISEGHDVFLDLKLNLHLIQNLLISIAADYWQSFDWINFQPHQLVKYLLYFPPTHPLLRMLHKSMIH